MNLNMIQPKNQTEDLLLSITKNCEMLLKQTHRKPKETLEFKMINPRETFHFNPLILIEGSWMIGLTSLEVYNSITNITENNEFEHYTGCLDDEVSNNQFKDNIAMILGLPNITPEELSHETFGPKFIEIYRILSMEKRRTDGYYMLLKDYVRSSFGDFESYLRISTGLSEDDIQLILKQYNSKFITYKFPPGAYTFKDLSIVLSRGFINEFEIRGRMRANHKHDLSDSIIIDSDNVSLTELRLGPQIRVLKFDKESFFNTVLGFTPYLDYKDFGKNSLAVIA